MDRAAAHPANAYRPALAAPEGGAPLCPTWLPWLLSEASARGVAVAGVIADEDGWRTCRVSDLVDLAPDLLRVCRRPGCHGTVTRLVLTRGGVVLGAALAQRAPAHGEPVTWRALLAEALARDATAVAAR